MKFTNTAIVLLAGAVVIFASPTAQSVDSAAEIQDLTARSNPEFNKYCKKGGKQELREGKCNGNSCYLGFFQNYNCNLGKCTKQSGGGDGKRCCYNVDRGATFCPGG